MIINTVTAHLQIKMRELNHIVAGICNEEVLTASHRSNSNLGNTVETMPVLCSITRETSFAEQMNAFRGVFEGAGASRSCNYTASLISHNGAKVSSRIYLSLRSKL